MPAAVARKTMAAGLAARLRQGGRPEWIEKALARACEATDAELARVAKVVTGILAGSLEVARTDALGPAITVQDFGEAWTNGKLHTRFPDHVKAKRTADADALRLAKHVYPHIGEVPIAAFRLEHAELVMREASSELATATRRQIAQAMHRLLSLAVYPARLLSANPLPRGFLPRVTRPVLEAWLYPSEDAALLAVRSVPVIERLFYGVLAREGLRSGEALALRFGDLDLDRGR